MRDSFSAAILLSSAKGVFSALLCWSIVRVARVLCVGELEGEELEGWEVVRPGLDGWVPFTMLY
jgi:hypothetical protein